jgi:hypothetical protein
MKRAGPRNKAAHRATPHATKTQRLGESPVTLRLPVDLVARVDALLPAVARDSDTATLLGGVSRSALLRLVIVEGMRVLEARYRESHRPGGGAAAEEARDGAL